jgi:hypothetical protein
MDIKDKIEDLVDKVKSDKDFASKFSSDPVKAIESVLEIDLPDDQIKSLIDGVKAKVSLDQAGDLLGSIKKLF